LRIDVVETAALKGGVAKSRTRRRPSRLRVLLRKLGIAAVILIALPIVLVPLYSVVNPSIGTMMILKTLGTGAGIDKQWADLDEISPRLVRAVLAAEDARFCSHSGIDWVEVQNALEDDDGKRRGASTITMQVARNLFLWGGKSWVRKGIEAPLALYLDLALSKRRILEIYLNIAEMGRGVYGAGAAARTFFNVPPDKLSSTQAALIAAALPSPGVRNPAQPTRGLMRIARRIAARASQLGEADDCILG
jgi:monofunctional biosynthetic peptidoglycan transglycosylase